MKNNIKKEEIALVYLVAGISSRFGEKSKSFARVGPAGETLIEYSLNQALKSEFSKIIFVVGNKTERQFKKKFKNSYKGVPVFYALQSYDETTRDKPWGTADALCSVHSLLDCPFVMCNGDDIYGENSFNILVKHLKTSREDATVAYKLLDVLPENGSVNRGIIQSKAGYIISIHDSINILKSDLKSSKREPDDLCSMSLFALYPDSLKFLKSAVEKFKEQNKGDRKAETGLPDQITELIKKRKIKMKIYIAVDKWFGPTNPEDEEAVRISLKSL